MHAQPQVNTGYWLNVAIYPIGHLEYLATSRFACSFRRVS
jgi:hypothetical protein